MIIIIDYKMGNVGSILNMLKKIGAEAKISSDPEEIKKAEKLVLPGVGAFDTGIKNLNHFGLVSVLNEKILKDKTPIIGICLGMQLFARKSEEGRSEGFGWIAGNVVKFKFSKNGLRIPHMGWNTIKIKREDDLLKNLPDEPRFYFVHSYYFHCDDKNEILAETNYGYDFPSIVRKNNIIGVQFHPEKSHKFGMRLLKNFVELC